MFKNIERAAVENQKTPADVIQFGNFFVLLFLQLTNCVFSNYVFFPITIGFIISLLITRSIIWAKITIMWAFLRLVDTTLPLCKGMTHGVIPVTYNA